MSIPYASSRAIVVSTFSDPAADNQRIHLFKAPLAGEVLSASIVCQDAQASGSAGTFQLENWGTAGTAVSGTIAVGLGGTAVAARLSAETPASYTISQGTFAANEWIVVDYQEDGDWVETNVTIQLEIAWGIAADA